jgi:hypothetical protein
MEEAEKKYGQRPKKVDRRPKVEKGRKKEKRRRTKNKNRQKNINLIKFEKGPKWSHLVKITRTE